MKYREINPPPSHPIVITLAVRGADLTAVKPILNSRDDVEIYCIDDRSPNWIVYLACTSSKTAREVLSQFETRDIMPKMAIFERS